MWKQLDNHDRLGGNIPLVCSDEPQYNSGFCKQHGEMVVKLGWPTKLREFLLKCGTNPSGFNKESAKRVDDQLTKLAKLAEIQPGETVSNPAYTKTTNYFLRSKDINAADFSATTPADDEQCDKVMFHQLTKHKNDSTELKLSFKQVTHNAKFFPLFCK